MQQQIPIQQPTQYEEVSSPAQLLKAWKLVKANRGAPGVDGVTIEEFNANLKGNLKLLSTELQDWNYRPSPVRRVEIPKPGSAEKRKLGIPTVRDRVVQQSLKLSLEPLFEPGFSDSSHGFRPGRGQQTAIAHCKSIMEEGKEWVVDIDLEKFFDRINQDRVIFLLKKQVKDTRILRLIGEIMRSGVLEGEVIKETLEGSPQGSPVSPLLSNIVLDELDKELERRGLSFCRYADDAKIYVGSRKAGQRVMQSISTFIENKLKLKVNQAKSKVGQTADIVFLGFVVTKDFISISKKSYDRAMSKVKELVRRRTHIPLEDQIRTVNQWYRGWAAYYRLTNYPSQLATIEAHIRRRFRAQFVSNQKKRRNLAKKFIKLGVPGRLATSQSYKSRGWWWLSHSRAAEIAWSNAWFRAQGLTPVSDRPLSHWESIRIWKKPL
jgi:group II intron reverse transcriptase/maturase